MRTAEDVLAIARELADEVLFPDAMRVDRLDVLPAAYLDALAAAGLYGAPRCATGGSRRPAKAAPAAASRSPGSSPDRRSCAPVHPAVRP
jgi:hypothetical protein